MTDSHTKLATAEAARFLLNFEMGRTERMLALVKSYGGAPSPKRLDQYDYEIGGNYAG